MQGSYKTQMVPNHDNRHFSEHYNVSSPVLNYLHSSKYRLNLCITLLTALAVSYLLSTEFSSLSPPLLYTGPCAATCGYIVV